MFQSSQPMLATPAPRCDAEADCWDNRTPLSGANRLQRLCGDGVQLEWDLARGEIAVFSRNGEGGDILEPAAVCSLDEWLDCVASGDRGALRDKLLALAASSTRSFEAQFRLAGSDGHQPWADLQGLVVRDSTGRARRVVAHQAKLAASGDVKPTQLPSPFHDPLTGLPNRRLFQRCVSRAVESARQEGRCGFAILFVDLDRFKAINDRDGHLVGDHTLLAVAHRLSHSVRPDDVVARRDGDEFTILLTDIWQPADAVAVADRILHQLRSPLSLEGTEIVVTASIGIALSGADSLEPDELLHSADLAMYQAKAGGGDAYLLAGSESHGRYDMQRAG